MTKKYILSIIKQIDALIHEDKGGDCVDKKKLFKILDVAVVLILLIPVLIPQKIDSYMSIWTAIIIAFALLAYYAIRSEIAKVPYWNTSWKRVIVSLICFLAMLLIDVLLNRFGDYPSLMLFEGLTAISVGEIYETYFVKKVV